MSISGTLCALLLSAFAVACGSDTQIPPPAQTTAAGAAGGEGAPGEATQVDSPASDSVSALMDSVMRIADASRIAGKSDARVWLVIISDFQCSFCRQWHVETYPRIRRDYVDRGLVRLAYVNSLGPTHVHAAATAEYAFCAGLQGKFWEYHDALFRTYDTWTRMPAGTRYFDQLAGELKLDAADMQLCISSGMMRRLVAADDMRSTDVGVTGTPSFLIDGRLVVGIQPFEVLSRRLDAAIAAARNAAPPPGGSGGGM